MRGGPEEEPPADESSGNEGERRELSAEEQAALEAEAELPERPSTAPDGIRPAEPATDAAEAPPIAGRRPA